MLFLFFILIALFFLVPLLSMFAEAIAGLLIRPAVGISLAALLAGIALWIVNL